MNLAVQIVRFVDYEPQPGIVAEFVDAENRSHTIIDKVPTFSALLLDDRSLYPQRGSMHCEVLDEFQDSRGCRLVRISTPGVESADGVTEFVVLQDQVSSGD